MNFIEDSRLDVFLWHKRPRQITRSVVGSLSLWLMPKCVVSANVCSPPLPVLTPVHSSTRLRAKSLRESCESKDSFTAVDWQFLYYFWYLLLTKSVRVFSPALERWISSPNLRGSKYFLEQTANCVHWSKWFFLFLRKWQACFTFTLLWPSS